MRLSIEHNLLSGTAGFEQIDSRAILAYSIKPGTPVVPVGTVIDIEHIQWTVVATKKSKFNPNVINVYLELVEPDIKTPVRR